jgi:WS/DGAT/MGAT family acyltransferase
VSSKKLGPLDLLFLALESRESMMHVGGLHIFSPPENAAPDFLRRVVNDFWSAHQIHRPWNLKLTHPGFLAHPLQKWVEDDRVDLDYHIRRSALPAPGDERELGILVSRLHSNPMDFHRPLWELHIIEGLSGGRFALYFKMHHAVMDGYSATQTLLRSFSRDPGEKDTALFFSHPPKERPSGEAKGTGRRVADLAELLRGQAGATADVGRALLNVARGKDGKLVRPLESPQTIINRRINRNRRFATQSISIQRMKRIAKAADGTLNDVVLALSAGALRRLLLELDALPTAPMTAMVPVNIRPKDDPGGGNAVGAILVAIATDVADPKERLRAIIASSRRAKEQLQGMSRTAILEYSALLLAPVGIGLLTGAAGRMRPAFNLVISNVQGPQNPLYFRGARIEESYPLSIPFHGYGLNITTYSYLESLGFGFTGCRDTVPHLQRLAVYSSEALSELEGSSEAPLR